MKDFRESDQIAKIIKILLRKQEFIGDIDDDESLNYVFLPPNPRCIHLLHE